MPSHRNQRALVPTTVSAPALLIKLVGCRLVPQLGEAYEGREPSSRVASSYPILALKVRKTSQIVGRHQHSV